MMLSVCRRLAAFTALLAACLVGESGAWAYTNPPVPNSSGVTTEVCDVRNNQDSGEKSLRHRLELFNAEATGGPQKCIFGIYFLDPATIKLQTPLLIKGLKHSLKNGKQAGTYISGADTEGRPLPVVIDATSVTDAAGKCAFMLEGGLNPIQQIHKVTLIVTRADRAICDSEGNDLMEQTIPENDVRQECAANAKAKDCDFKNVTLVVDNPVNDRDGDGIDDEHDLCPDDAGLAKNGGCPDGKCISQIDGSVKEETGVDADGDGIDAACDLNDTPVTPIDTDGDGILDDGDDSGAVGDNPCTGGAVAGCDDNCPSDANADQLDADADGIGDVCEGSTTDADGDGVLDDVDLCPADAGPVSNGGCPTTKCIGQGDGLPHDKTGTDADGDGIDAACDLDDGGPSVTPSPTCSLTAVVAVTGFDLTWTSMNGVSAELSDGVATLSTDLNHAMALNVVPVAPTTYTLTVDGEDGTQCVHAILLTPGDPVPTAPTCDLSAAVAVTGFDLSWTSANGSTASLTEEGNVTPLSTDLNSAAPLNVNPAGPKHYTLEVLGAGGECGKTVAVAPASSTADGDGDGVLDDVDLCPADAGPVSNGGCPTTKCIGQVDGLPHDKTGTDADADGIDAACDANDTPGSVGPAPTCDLTAVVAVAGFDLTWTSTNGTTASLMEEGNVTPLSTDLNHPAALNVNPGSPKTYTLTVTGTGGVCSDAITLTPGSPVPTAPTCDLDAAAASGGFDLTWTSSDGTTAELTEEGNVTPLSTDLNSASPVHVEPTSAKLFTLEVTGSGGICSKGILLSPSTDDADGDGIVDSVDNCDDNPEHDLTDTDDDGLGNPCDPDDDNDEVLDGDDNCPVVPNPNQADGDGNDVGDACQVGGSGSVGNDSDGDGLGDDLEEDVFGTDPNNPDSDGDGLNDGDEVGSPYFPVCGPLDPDCDDDGVCDGPGTVNDAGGGVICQPFDGHGDNCILVSNGPNTPDISEGDIQLDTDGNGVGDVCEGDRDGDGVLDEVDNCPFIPNDKQEDQDSNGIGDACDPNFSFVQGGGGCGCRMDGGSADSNDALPFFLMGLPLLALRAWRKRTEVGK